MLLSMFMSGSQPRSYPSAGYDAGRRPWGGLRTGAVLRALLGRPYEAASALRGPQGSTHASLGQEPLTALSLSADGAANAGPGWAGGPALLFGGVAPGYRLIAPAPTTTRRHGRGGHPVLGQAGSCDRRADAHPAPDLYAGTPCARRSAAQLGAACPPPDDCRSRARWREQVWEELTQQLEEKLSSQEHYAACVGAPLLSTLPPRLLKTCRLRRRMLAKVYRELMILGFISFGVVVCGVRPPPARLVPGRRSAATQR